MSKTLVPIILFIVLASCGIRPNSKYDQVCDCCELTYTNISGALKCISNSDDHNNDRLMLVLAVIPKNRMDEIQSNNWDILGDADIETAVKRDYLLVFIQGKELSIIEENHGEELLEIYSKANTDIYFIITNQLLYPFASWTFSDTKESILEKLAVGTGP